MLGGAPMQRQGSNDQARERGHDEKNAMSEAPRSALTQKECSTCFEPIDARAKKCLRCDSYQDWRRRLYIGSSVLALLVALVSVIAVAMPAVLMFFTPKDSNLEVEFHGSQGNRVFAVVANSGNRAGTITASRLYFRARSKSHYIDTEPRSLPFEPVLVQPGQAKLLVVIVPAEALQEIDRHSWQSLNSEYRHDQVFVIIDATNFKKGHSGFTEEIYGLQTASGPWSQCLSKAVFDIEFTGERLTRSDIQSRVDRVCGTRPPYVDAPLVDDFPEELKQYRTE
jgi:hypothetical protein